MVFTIMYVGRVSGETTLHQGDRKIYRSELRLFSCAISPTFLLSLIFQLQMSSHLLYPPCALRKPAGKKEHTLEGIITFK